MSKFRKALVNNKGFTLIELLVVIAVLGILAAIAIPRLTGVTDKARLSEAKSMIGTLKNAQEMFKTEYPDQDYVTADSSTDDPPIGDLGEYVDAGSLALDDWIVNIDGSSDSYTIYVYNSTSNLGAKLVKDGDVTTEQ